MSRFVPQHSRHPDSHGVTSMKQELASSGFPNDRRTKNSTFCQAFFFIFNDIVTLPVKVQPCYLKDYGLKIKQLKNEKKKSLDWM